MRHLRISLDLLVSPTALYVIGAGLLYLASLFVPDGAADGRFALSDGTKASLDYYAEICKVVGGLATALIAGCGALVIKGKDWSAQWGHFDAAIIVGALLAAAASLYGVYLGHIAVLQMTIEGVFDPFQARLSAALAIQYNGLLLGVFLLGLVFTRMLSHRT